jgi:hypothetical protein
MSEKKINFYLYQIKMPSSRKRKNTFPSKLKTTSTFYPKGTMSKSAKRIYNVSMNPKYAPGGRGSAIKWLTYYMNRAGKNLKNRKEIIKARRMLQKANKSGPFRNSTKKKKSRNPKKSSRKRRKPKKKSKKSSRKRRKPKKKSKKPKKKSKKPKKKARKFIQPNDCPTYKEILSDREIMKDWKFLYAPKAGVVRKSSRKELKDFRDSLTKRAAHNVIAFTPGYNHSGPQFPYFQCLYPNYNKNWAYGLNKKKGVAKNHVCPSPQKLRRMCSNKSRKLKHTKKTFRAVNAGSNFSPMSNNDYKKFCRLVQNSKAASISVNRNGAKKDLFCTYDWGKFAWEHGVTADL